MFTQRRNDATKVFLSKKALFMILKRCVVASLREK